MRKNPFIKSMMRQPARTALLAGLILLAAFAFSLRVVEYVIVRGQIYEIARYYRAIGHVSHPYRFGDISDAAEIIASDSRVDFIDRRRSVEGVLADVQNANFSGMARRGITFPTMRQRESSITEAYFYGELQTKIIRGNRIELHVLVDGVLAGHPEYIAPGQTVILRQHFENSNPGALDGISEGGRYFFRAAYFRIYPAWGDVIGPRLPRVGYLGDVLAIMPLNPQSDFAERIMFLPANALDFENPLFAHIPAEIEMLNRDHRAMSIQTTRDMTALPHIDQIFELLYGGRIIDKTDYLAGNRVAMIDATFARDRGFGVGDTLILDVPRSQHYAGEIGIAGFTAPLHRAARDHAEHHDNYYTLELEIVGITRLHPRNFTLDTRQSFFVWIPDSALPNDIETAGLGEMPDALFSFSIGDSRDNEAFYAEFSELLADMGYMLHMDFPDSLNFWATAEPVLVIIFFNAVLFVIVLLAVLSLVTFLYKKQRHKEFAVMRALGTPARVILARILASVFLVALVPSFAGAFAGWYVALNRSESTLLGFEDAYLDAIPPDGLLLFWNNLMGEGATIPAGLTVSIRTVDIAADLGAIWAVGLGAITFGIFFLMIAYAGISLLRLPVLMLLQGRAVKVRPPKIAVKDGSDAPPVQVFAKTPFPTKTLKRDTRLIWRNSLVYIRRHIVRVPIQSGLRLFVAMFFVFALGWISESILQTNREIDRLYDTTIVWGEIIHCPIFLAELEMANIGRPPLDTYNPDWLVIRPGWDIYGVRMESDSWISRGRIRRVMETGMVEETYRESIFVHSFTIAPDEFGSLPWNWRVQVGYFRHMRTTFDINPTAINQLLAFNDYNTFTSRHSGFDINWAPGFDSS
ncbi:MAG: ABC transporter permease, partial [Defluviitaleaceae bacterium]|nr:ABC transporter permease [Defluviitaleaceae bacterium]